MLYHLFAFYKLKGKNKDNFFKINVEINMVQV